MESHRRAVKPARTSCLATLFSSGHDWSQHGLSIYLWCEVFVLVPLLVASAPEENKNGGEGAM